MILLVTYLVRYQSSPGMYTHMRAAQHRILRTSRSQQLAHRHVLTRRQGTVISVRSLDEGSLQEEAKAFHRNFSFLRGTC